MTFLSQTVRPSSTPDIVVPEIGCSSDVEIGDWVRISPENFAIRALADSFQNSEVFGLVEDKSTSEICIVRIAGVSKPIFADLDTNKSYFLSENDEGQMNTLIPINSGAIVLSLGRSLDGERFLVQPTLRMQRA